MPGSPRWGAAFLEHAKGRRRESVYIATPVPQPIRLMWQNGACLAAGSCAIVAGSHEPSRQAAPFRQTVLATLARRACVTDPVGCAGSVHPAPDSEPD